MEHTFTQEELREALLAALLDYETVKKTRRIKAAKKALQGTMMATLIGGSAGLMAAGHGRAAPAREAAVMSAAQLGQVAVLEDFPQAAGHSKFIPGAAHFGLNKHALAASQEGRLLALARELPRGAEVSVIGRTDASGSKRHNQRLGLQRAQAAADFLALHGVKVKAVGSKVSNYMPENWMQRRVDIVVDAPQPFALGGAAPAPHAQAHPATVQPPAPPAGHDADYRRQPHVSERALGSAVPPAEAAQPKPAPYAGGTASSARPVERSVPPPAALPPRPVARKPAATPSPAVSNIAITDAKPPVGGLAKPGKGPAPSAGAPSLKGAAPEDGAPAAQASPLQPGLQRQVIRGATHFAANSYALAWAHKARLIELVRQLPKDAELTVVGRTESNGAEDANKDLGKLRAITVATFLTNFGVKVKAVGSKQANDRFTGWGARRVDIVVDSAPTQRKVSLPQPSQDEPAHADPRHAGQRTPYLYKVD